ncbi:TetR/AcrR family transcriptional regulator [Mycolicibacterium arenosum]|uniref:TetR/AcrR family transcriptional regulator n=1 Tax=Mycolicibacterium arenosum TaxID=2952157 RepID=A0ABT1LVQ9_9MYCO|nr:TetR/AcrR family transcriptional regulator [Mycolicibacterium sp. CAU 1645]MCP9270976.1 TetR/AcrR family transcriptional regulator [Mycolicibacterium sp. CAU 1645]
MTTIDSTARPLSEQSLRERLCERAIEHFARFGFDMSMLEMAVAVDTDVRTLTEMFGSIEGLHAACDDYLQDTVRKAKTEALTNPDPRPWFAQVADIESFAPMMSYLVRTLQSGGESARALFQQMTDNAERYLEDAVRVGTVKPTRDPRARAHFLTMAAGGGFLLYLQLHRDPSDMRAVLRDYARDVMLPALELYTYGLMADDSMYQAFVAQVEPR